VLSTRQLECSRSGWERGYLKARRDKAFNMLASNDLIWPYIITIHARNGRCRSICCTGIRMRRGCAAINAFLFTAVLSQQHAVERQMSIAGPVI